MISRRSIICLGLRLWQTIYLLTTSISRQIVQPRPIIVTIIHQIHYKKSDWSRAFNQFTIACELDMINAVSAGDIAFIMSSSTSAWILSPLECSPRKQNG